MMVLAVLVMVALVYQADPDEMQDLIEGMDLSIIAGVIILYLVNMVAKVLRWYALLSRKEGTPPLGKVALYFLIGMAINNSTPGRVSGEPVRAYLIKTGTDYPMGRGMASIFMEKTIDTIVTLALALVGILLLITIISPEATNKLLLSVGLVALFMGAIILVIIYPGGLRRLSASVFRWLRGHMSVTRVDSWEEKTLGALGTFEIGTREIARNRMQTMAASGLTIIIWLNEALRLWLVFYALGYNISAELMLVAVCLASFAALLIPLGAGSSTAIAAICILAGVDPTLSTTAGLVFVMTSIWISLPLGAAAMAISGLRAKDVFGDRSSDDDDEDEVQKMPSAGEEDAEVPSPSGASDGEDPAGVMDAP